MRREKMRRDEIEFERGASKSRERDIDRGEEHTQQKRSK
jgi:hypothetical protein